MFPAAVGAGLLALVLLFGSGAALADALADLAAAQAAIEGGDPAGALQRVDRAIDSQALRGQPLAQAYVLRGVALHRGGDPARAVESYHDALKIDPLSVDAFSNLGLAFDDLNRPAEAVQAHDRAVWLRPDLAAPFYNRGNSYNRAGEFGLALQDYSRVLALEPDHTAALTNRATVYLRQGHYVEAFADYARVLDITPDDPLAWFTRANAFLNIGAFNRAEADFGAAIERGHKTAVSYQRRGDARFLLGNFEAARQDYARAILAGSTDGQLLLWHHLAAGRAGRPNSRSLVSAFERGDLGHWQGLAAKVLLGKSDPVEALAAAAPGAPVREAATRRARLLFYVGAMHLLAGRDAAAVEAFRETVEGSPDRTKEVLGAEAELARLGQEL